MIFNTDPISAPAWHLGCSGDSVGAEVWAWAVGRHLPTREAEDRQKPALASSAIGAQLSDRVLL